MRDWRVMKTVNALKLRNKLGEVLDALDETGEPILVTKGGKIRAALITAEQFEKRFVDFQADEKKKALLATIRGLKAGRKDRETSLDILRELRGYEK